MRHAKTVLAVLGAVTVLVLAGNTIALATTGHPLILGQGNTADNITGMTRTTYGSVLKLTTKSSASPPLIVTGKGKVTNLNADTVDGYDSSAMRNRTYNYGVVVDSATSGFSATVPLPNGSYTFDYSAFLQTAGTSGTSSCQVHWERGFIDQYYGLTEFTETATANPALSGSGRVTVGSDDVITFECTAPTSFTTHSEIPISLTFTPTTLLSNTFLTPAPLP